MSCELCLHREHAETHTETHNEKDIAEEYLNHMYNLFEISHLSWKICMKNIISDLYWRLPPVEKSYFENGYVIETYICDTVTFSKTLLFLHISKCLENDYLALITLMIKLVMVDVNILCVLDILIMEILKIYPINDLTQLLSVLENNCIRLNIIKIMDRYDLINPQMIIEYIRYGPTVEELRYFSDSEKYITANIWTNSKLFYLTRDLPLFIKIESIWGPCPDLECLLNTIYRNLPHNFNEHNVSLHVLKYVMGKYENANVVLTNILEKSKECRLLAIANTYA